MNTTTQTVLDALWFFSKDGNKALKPSNIVSRIKRRTGLSELDIGLGFDELRTKKLVRSAGWAISPTRPTKMIEVEPPVRPVPEWEMEWDTAVKKVGLNKDDASQFSAFASVVKDFSISQKCMFLEGLSRLCLDKGDLAGEAKYNVSATYLLGSSKLLDKLGRPLSAIELDCFQPSPKYIAVAGSQEPQAVVLVENPNAFETAVASSDLSRVAWACTYGFGLGNEKADQDGAMLEANLTSKRTYILVREGSPPRDIHVLLGCENLYFWGDLDLTGLRIYDNLKRHYPSLQLSALYEPMIQALVDGRCHPYTDCVGKKKQRAVELKKAPLNDALARELAKMSRDCAVDQEIVSRNDIEALAGKPLLPQNIKKETS